MGKRYISHDSMCGCERCARSADSELPGPVFEIVFDPDYLDCGCHASRCDCDDWDDHLYDDSGYEL